GLVVDTQEVRGLREAEAVVDARNVEELLVLLALQCCEPVAGWRRVRGKPRADGRGECAACGNGADGEQEMTTAFRRSTHASSRAEFVRRIQRSQSCSARKETS